MPHTFSWKNNLQPFLKRSSTLYFIYGLLAFVAGLIKYSKGSYNNYLIYKNVFYHTLAQTSLYADYPSEYLDSNHYGPLFSVIIAPFALLPDFLGSILWVVFGALFLGWSFKKLPLSQSAIAALFFICANELFTSLVSFQFNPVTAGLVILSYIFVEEEKDFWSACCIVTGTLVKLYGIVGLVFFLFSKHKLRFIYSLIFWFSALFAVPMALSSYDYIVYSYNEWYLSLSQKNSLNADLTSYQDFSLMGLVRRITQNAALPNLPFLLGGLVLYALPLIRFKFYGEKKFQLLILASTLLFIVLFSTGSESPSYIIAFSGVGIWFVSLKRPVNKFYIAIFIFALLFSSFGSTDLFPKSARTFMRLYALKALPCLLLWLCVIYDAVVRKFEQQKEPALSYA